MTVRVGQVGVGRWGTLTCKALTSISAVELVGIHDIDDDRAESISERYKVKAFNNLDSLLEAVDAVVVTVPTKQHFEIAHRALSRDVSIFVEKPITAAVSEAEALVQLAQERDLTFQVGHIERFNPAVIALNHEDIRPQYIEANRITRYDGRGGDVGVVLDLMIHDLDLVLNFAKSEVSEIKAQGSSVMTQDIDVAQVMILFKSGCVAVLMASRAAFHNMRQMYIYQDRAAYRLDFIGRKANKLVLDGRYAEVESASNPPNSSQIEHDFEPLASDDDDALCEELKAFVHSVKTGVQPVVDGLQGKRVLKLATEIRSQILDQKNA